jgi:ferredoxin-NADP reductase
MVEIEAKIKEIIPRTYNVKSFRAEINEEVDFKAGQFLQVTLNNDPNLKRYLSISNSPTETGYLEFTKKLTESDFSQALNSLKVGDSLKVKYPFGKFTLDESCKKIAFLSGGIGITPIRSIAKYAADKKLGTDIILLYGNRTEEDIVFKDDFEQMQKEYPKFKVAHLIGQRMDKEFIQKEAPDYKERKFYLCGPPAMVEAMKKILLIELGLPEASIITENFQGY